jgi:hypothetical protein
MGLISTGPGSPLAFSSASGGKVYGYNNVSAAAPIVVAQANPSRQKITFHNPGTVDIYIGPSFVQNVIGSAPINPTNVAFVPTTILYGGCFRVYANGGTLVLEGECQGAWQALSVSGTDNPLTVMDSNL